MAGYIGIGFVALLAVGFILINNQIIGKKNKVKEAFGSIDAYLKKRFDLIPNLVAVVNKYAAHEKEVLSEITQIRSKLDTADSASEKMGVSNALTSLLSGLHMVVENYPDLKADGQYLNLQHNLTDVEEQISAARRTYNAAITKYNNSIQMFPGNVVATIRGDKAGTILEAPENERENIDLVEILD
ncbi:MAG: LemA family protein [Gilvibacter sp.]